MHGSAMVDVPDLLGTIHPFLRTNQSLLHTAVVEIGILLREKQARKIGMYLSVNFLCTILLLIWCNSTNSMGERFQRCFNIIFIGISISCMALTAYAYLTIFDMFSMMTCLVSLWVRRQHSSPIFSFGYERFEVLVVFASTVLAQLGALFIVKESIERMVEQPDIHTGRLLVGTAFAFISHMFITYSVENQAFNNVILASSSSWLQEHVTDISESLCHVIPGLAKILLPRINPFALVACAGAIALIITHFLIDIYNYYAADTWAAAWIALMTCGTMFPMSVYSGKILLQTTPSHMIGQLDKCIREASTLDGVLEFRHEHFWTVAFDKMAGSVHVRVRRDADEQMVLAHVYHRLANLVSVLTVQIFKDDWSRPSAFQILGDTSLLSKIDKSLPPPPAGISGGPMAMAFSGPVPSPQMLLSGYRLSSSSLPTHETGPNRQDTGLYSAASPSFPFASAQDSNRRFIPALSSSTGTPTSVGEKRPVGTTAAYWTMQARAVDFGSGYGSATLVSVPANQQQSDKHK